MPQFHSEDGKKRFYTVTGTYGTSTQRYLDKSEIAINFLLDELANKS